jgi:DNA polymerase-1
VAAEPDAGAAAAAAAGDQDDDDDDAVAAAAAAPINVRAAFVAPAGRLLLSADFSQVELCMLAHFSGG